MCALSLSSSLGVICNNCSRNNLANRGKGQVWEVNMGGMRRRKERTPGEWLRPRGEVNKDDENEMERWKTERRGVVPSFTTSLCCCIKDEWCLSVDRTAHTVLPLLHLFPALSWRPRVPQAALKSCFSPCWQLHCAIAGDTARCSQQLSSTNHASYGGQGWHST